MASTSTPAPTSKPFRVRRKGAILSAQALTTRSNVWLPGNALAIGNPGDLVISDEKGTIDLQKEGDFKKLYEIIEEGIFLHEKYRSELERVLGVGAAKDGASLTAAVDRLARCEIGGILVDFTPGQWEELRRKAEVQSQSVEEYLGRLVKKFTADIWTL